mgnify:CR=1 FL=1
MKKQKQPHRKTGRNGAGAGHATDSVRGLLNALMLDVALVDPDVQDAAILRAAGATLDWLAGLGLR